MFDKDRVKDVQVQAGARDLDIAIGTTCTQATSGHALERIGHPRRVTPSGLFVRGNNGMFCDDGIDGISLAESNAIGSKWSWMLVQWNGGVSVQSAPHCAIHPLPCDARF